jgi:autotransporter-associated beta strand protein
MTVLVISSVLSQFIGTLVITPQVLGRFCPRHFRIDEHHLAWLRIPSLVASGCIAAIITLMAAGPASAIVYRSDLTDQQVQDLAKQGQFSGTGYVNGGGTAVAIAPRWVMTARHVGENFVNQGRQQFVIGGVAYNGDRIIRTGTDIALIYLDNALPANTTFIAPNPGHNAVGNLVWKVGRGTYGPVGGTTTSGGITPQRAGTNIIGAREVVGLAPGETGIGLRFNNNNTAANSTSFEVHTGPGDSGGPLFLQHNNQWFVAGTTLGFSTPNANPFIENDVADVYDWVLSEVRAKEGASFNFAPQAAPTKLTFDRDFTTDGVQSGSFPGFAPTWNNDRPMFYANGFNYTWENDAPPVAVFGTANTSASIVSVTDAIKFSGIEFAPTVSTSGPFQIQSSGSGTLEAVSGGAFIEANEFGAVSAKLTGTNNITKRGTADLLLSGDNSAFGGQLIVEQGTMIVNASENLGTGGFFSANKTVVQDGATLQLRGAGLTSGEQIHLSGVGFDNRGALYVSTGAHTLTERIAVITDATINIDAGASLTIGVGDPALVGGFYRNAGPAKFVTQAGDGTAVYDNINNISGLSVINGVAAGDGGLNGTLSLTTGAELRPGDSATAMEFGEFNSSDFSMDGSSFLTLDLDPASMLVDLVNVNGTIHLDGTLKLNLFSAPTEGDAFKILENNGTDGVVGMFASGTQVSAMFGGQNYDFAINYAAGSGNDVFLAFAVAVPEPSTFVLLGVAAIGAASRRRRI